jgi:nucleoside 2-deoxyribosyltransferase
MTAIYLASSYSRRLEMVEHAAELTALGHTVVSTWVNGHHETRPNIDAEATDAERRQWAEEDLRDIDLCDLMIVSTDSGHQRGGKWVEMGYALALRKQVWIVGPRENVFTCLAEAEQFDTWPECLAFAAQATDEGAMEVTTDG